MKRHIGTERRTLRLTPEEAAALTQAAGGLGLSENAYLRRALSITLRLDAFTEEPTVYQSWFRQGLADLFAAANLAAVTGQALVSLQRARMVQAAEAQGMPQVFAEAEADTAIEAALVAARDVLATPEIRAIYGSLVPNAEPDDAFWEEVDHGRQPPIEGG